MFQKGGGGGGVWIFCSTAITCQPVSRGTFHMQYKFTSSYLHTWLTYYLHFAGMRAEEFVYQKLDKPKPPRLTESESLGQSMIEAGNDFGPGTNYG